MFAPALRTLAAALAALLLIPVNATNDSSSPSPVSGTTPRLESAYLGGGCFWCLEAFFETLPGVKNVVSGYAGGHVDAPSYREVCTGSTGHAEVVRVDFDPAVISYEALLEKFWLVHDPTSLNRQGPDEGTQYRSIILCVGDAQRATAERSRSVLQAKLAEPVVTQLEPLVRFYEAEEYHQDYFRRNPNQGYCRVVIAPKLKKLIGK